MRKVIVIYKQELYDENKYKDNKFDSYANIDGYTYWLSPCFAFPVYESVKAFLVTDELIINLQEITEDIEGINKDDNCKVYFIEDVKDKDNQYIEKLKRKYENKPNFWERIFGFNI